MKKTIKRIIASLRIFKPLKVSNNLMILNYHRLNDPLKPQLFDDGVFGPNGARFEMEMNWLKKETQILSQDELIDVLYNNKKVSGVCSMVTFDDGYVDNYEIAYPILKKLSIPAIFFIPTKHINERTLGWWDITAYLVKLTKLKSVNFHGRKWNLLDRLNTISDIILELKKMDPKKVDFFLEDLANALEVPLPSLELQDKELMTWEQIKEVSRNGISIGSHTHEHVILSKQDLSDMRVQVKRSKDILEEKLDIQIKTLAYPVGGYDHFNEENMRITKELGFKIGFSFLTGVNRFGSIDPFNVKRGTSQPDWQNLDLALAFPKRYFPSVRNN